VNSEFAGPYELWRLMALLVEMGGQFEIIPGFGWKARISDQVWIGAQDLSPETLREAWAMLKFHRAPASPTPTPNPEVNPEAVAYARRRTFLDNCLYEVMHDGAVCDKCGKPHTMTAEEAYGG
jgi:hypothetical protein